jgi:hypothetical protein
MKFFVGFPKAVCCVSCAMLCLVAAGLSGCSAGSTPTGSIFAGETTTTTALFTSSATVATGGSVTLTATVSPGAATGTVTFYDGGSSLGTAPLSSGSATLVTSFATAGSHTLTAAYSGAGTTYVGSTSSALLVTVTTTVGSTSTCGFQDSANHALASAVDSYTSGTTTLSSPTINASGTNESAVCAANSGTTVTLTSPTIGSSSSTSYQNDSSFYGLNAAVLAYGSGSGASSGAVVNITGGNITTTGSFGSGVYAAAATVNISGTTVNATGSGGHGLYCSQGAVMNISNVTVNTTNQTGSAVATDSGGCTITLNGGSYTTSGAKSAGLYSTGSISATGATFSAGNAPVAVIDGSNSITVNTSTLTGANGDGRGVFLFSSTATNATASSDTYIQTGGSLTYSCPASACSGLSATAGQNVPATMFAVTNTKSAITLSNVTMTNNAGTLLEAQAMTNGTTGQNCGLATLNASGTAMTGDVIVDSISTATLMLSGGSSLTGAINNAKTGSVVGLTLDSTSKWTVTGTSYLTSLSDAAGISGTAVSNIVGNGNTVYYLSANNPLLGGLTYTLSGGGSLKPY